MAGILAARSNRRGIVGVAPRSKLLYISHNTDVSFDYEVRWAVARGADVINMSFGTFGYVLPFGESSAIEYAWSKGVVLIAAAGNDSKPSCAFPAVADHVLCVGATDRSELHDARSNWGVGLDLVAPGGAADVTQRCPGWNPMIESTFADLIPEHQLIVSTASPETKFCGVSGYGSFAGTSLAAPHVSGVAALLVSLGLNNEQIVSCLTRTATDLGAPGYDPIYGHGLVNAYRAVRDCS